MDDEFWSLGTDFLVQRIMWEQGAHIAYGPTFGKSEIDNVFAYIATTKSAMEKRRLQLDSEHQISVETPSAEFSL